MSFFDIIKEAREKGILLDGCGTTKRYYTFGAFVDLCGAEPEELMPKCCGDSPTPPGPTPTNNVINLDVINDSGNWIIEATPTKPVASDLTVTITYEYDGTENTETFTIPTGSSSENWNLNVPTGTKEVYIVSAEVSPTSDETYKYSVAFTPAPFIESDMYYGILPYEHGDILVDDIENMNYIEIDKTVEAFDFTIEPIGVDGWDDMPDDEMNALKPQYAYDFIIAINTNIANYKIMNILGTEDTKFILSDTLTIDSKEYNIFKRSDIDSQLNVYDPNYSYIPDPYTYEYTIEISI